jgi:hypothetical protein
MYTVYLCLGLAILLFIIDRILHYRVYKAFDFDIDRIALGFFITILLSLLITLALPEDREYQMISRQQIVALKDNTKQIHYLYSSASSMDYTFYVKNNGYFEMQQLDYSCVKIKYTKGKPRIEKYDKVATNAPINNWAMDKPSYDEYYIIYVPDGTIKTELVLDAQ